MQTSSSVSSIAASSSDSVSFSSALMFGKTVFKCLLLNINGDVLVQRTPAQPQLRSSAPVIETTVACLMDIFRDQPPTNRPITTRLPPEIWFLILRFATCPRQNTTTTIPFHIRLANYASEIKWKASLTHVCKEWNIWGQKFLWENVWIASGRDGKVLVGVVRGGQPGKNVPLADYRHTDVRAVGPETGLQRVRDLRASSSPLSDGRFTRRPQTTAPKNIASYIRKLHIETPSMDPCSPFDLMLILERCQRLEVFIDLRSVRRGFGFVGVGAGISGGRLDASRKPSMKEGPLAVPAQRHLFPRTLSTPDPILQALLHLHPTTQKSTLKHLTFTNYKYDSDDFQGGVWFWEDLVGNALGGTGLAATLESLEVVMSTRGVGMGNNLDDYGYPRRNPFASGSTHGPSRKFETGLLTSLDLDIKSVNSSARVLTLPSLYSLRIPLTSPTLLVISTWLLPSLQSLCVVSIDFTGWRRLGFKTFMDVHGGGLGRFEIVGGGESGEEEGWITEREDAFYGVAPNLHQRQQHLHLPSTSPNLKHFICSSNASEWNWETPDWIAPHVLMPEHSGVETIGVWGLEGRVVRGDWGRSAASTGGGLGSRTISTWATSRWNRHSSGSDEGEEAEEQPFFMLQEQFGSILRREAFPSLVCVRDMSWESDLIRRSVGIGCGLSNVAKTNKKLKNKSSLASLASRFATVLSSSPPSNSSSPSLTRSSNPYRPRTQAQSSQIRKFWLGVLQMCDRRGVYLEDWMGRRVVV